MKESLANTTETAVGPISLREAYRRERRFFCLTCIWVGATAVSYLAGLYLNFRYMSEIRKWNASGRIDGFREIHDRYLSWAVTFSLAQIVTLLVFLVFLIRWILAIRRRRKLEAMAPSAQVR